MTSVYSGGLVYEYSEEGSGYGLVNISGTEVTTGDDFTALQKALKGTSNPSGDGNYNSTGGASGCPVKSSSWNVSSDALPAIPDKAKDYMTKGAGTGPGLTGDGSQNAGGTSTGTASAGSGQATATGSSSSASSTSSSSKSGAVTSLRPIDNAPLFVAGVAALCTFFGATLL